MELDLTGRMANYIIITYCLVIKTTIVITYTPILKQLIKSKFEEENS
jgi:hypothetical protein